MNGSMFFNGLKSLVRPTAVLAAGYLGGGLGVQFGPWIVNTVVNHTVKGYLTGVLYKQALNVAFGQYYCPIGQLAFSSAVAACPSPCSVARSVRTHFHQQNYMNELRNSQFDPKQLEQEEVEDGFVKCSYYGKEREMEIFVAPRTEHENHGIAETAV